MASFDLVDGVELVDVALVREPLPEQRTRSVQPMVDPRLIAPSHVSVYPMRVAVVPAGRLATDSGVVILPDDRLVRETVWDDAHFSRAFDPPPTLAPPTRIGGRHASLVSAWYHNFYHWMFEALPRLAVLEASEVAYDGLIVPERLSAFQLETLDLLGIHRDRLVPFKGEHVQVDELVWAAPLAPVGRPTPTSVAWLRKRLTPGGGGGHPTRRVYLPRTTHRRVVDENAVLDVVGAHGFDVVHPATLTFREQVALFAETAVVVGPHGAAFSNALFSPNLDALELYQPSHVNSSTLCAISSAGHRHSSLICRRALGRARPRNRDMSVPPGLVAASLAAMGFGA